MLTLYIVLFLHQTTTWQPLTMRSPCCISYYSYIKPQLRWCSVLNLSVVYRTIPTSNHNQLLVIVIGSIVVYRTIPTSNHNDEDEFNDAVEVVYRTIPTSNHNLDKDGQVVADVVYRTIPTSNHNYLTTV